MIAAQYEKTLSGVSEKFLFVFTQDEGHPNFTFKKKKSQFDHTMRSGKSRSYDKKNDIQQR